MWKYVLKRILLMIPVILGVLLIVFSINSLAGDPTNWLLGTDATEEAKQALRVELGLDKPFLVQYFNYIWGIVTRFDFGTTYVNKTSVAAEILSRFPITIKLGVFSLLFAVLMGIPFGVISATKQNTALDYTVTFASLVCAALPNFWLALMLILLFSQTLGWLPATGVETWKGWILPIISVGFPYVCQICRQTRSNMLDVIRQDYVRTLRAKGLGEYRVIVKHALKNALIPIITIIGTQFGNIMAGSVVVESIFMLPGIGTMMKNAIAAKDYPLILGGVAFLAVAISFINLFVDIIYGFIDPRILAQYTQGKKRLRKAVTQG